MTYSPALKVGILVFLAVLAFVLVFWFLEYYQLHREMYYISVVFTNSLGIMEGDPVRMAGVPIGSVRSLSLTKDTKASVLLGINRKYRIPKRSQFIIRVGLLIGERYIEIVPNRKAKYYLAQTLSPPYPTIIGEVPPRIEDLLPAAQALLSNLSETSQSLKALLGDKTLQSNIKETVANITKSAQKLEATMATLQNTVVRNQDDIDAITKNISDATENVKEITAELNNLAKSNELKGDITATVHAARETVESLDRTVASLEELVTAPEFQEDIRKTVSGARQAVEEARQVIDKVGRIFGGASRLKSKISTQALNLDMLYNPKGDHFRAELTATIPTGTEKFLELGMYDAGAGSKLILQPGQELNPQTRLRYGLYASRLGLGLDHAFSSKAFGKLDLFDPYEPKLNIRAGYRVTSDWAVLLGIDNLFGENQTVLGVKLNK